LASGIPPIYTTGYGIDIAEKVGADWPADQAVVDGNFRTEVKE
jgi:hypothetical protein